MCVCQSGYPFWLIDYRIYDPEGDGKTKLDHERDVVNKKLPFDRVVMLTWYATKAVMLHIEHLQKTYYCPIKKNRLVDDSAGENPYQRVEDQTRTGHRKTHETQRVPQKP